MNRDVQRKQQIEALILKYEKTVYKLANVIHFTINFGQLGVQPV